jgi:CRP-like cAMP-binding protein
MPVTADLLRTVPLFAGMTDTAIESVRGLAREVEFVGGEQLVRQGDPGETFLVIVEGRARVDQDGDTLRELGPGDYLGEIALIDGGPRTASVTAMEPIRALMVERTEFRRLIDDFSAVRFDVLTALTQRIRREASSPVD